MKSERAKQGLIARKHGKNHTPEYAVWNRMIERCTNQNHKSFNDYGGREIKICKQWRESFESFYADMGPRPSPEHSIDRINNDGNYEPGNCRWATRVQQGQNKRNNHRVTINGTTKSLMQWCHDIGISYATVYHRVRDGLSIEDAITIPQFQVRKGKRCL